MITTQDEISRNSYRKFNTDQRLIVSKNQGKVSINGKYPKK